jgi:hypothetical protein
MSMFKGRTGIAVAATAAAVALFGLWALAAQPSPTYVRIGFSNAAVVYVQMQGTEFRVAPTVEGLKTAKPILARQINGGRPQPTDVVLPFAQGALPEGVTSVTASLAAVQAQPRGGKSLQYLSGTVRSSRTDENKIEWSYEQRVAIQGGDKPEGAPVVLLAGAEKPTFVLNAKPTRSGGSLGVGVTLMAGKSSLTDVRKAGQPAEVSLTITDSAGKVAASAKGALSKFALG